jgi:hypothetical protein
MESLEYLSLVSSKVAEIARRGPGKQRRSCTWIVKEKEKTVKHFLKNSWTSFNTGFFCFQVVVGGGRMKFNKTEMAVLAGQPGHR